MPVAEADNSLMTAANKEHVLATSRVGKVVVSCNDYIIESEKKLNLAMLWLNLTAGFNQIMNVNAQIKISPAKAEGLIIFNRDFNSIPSRS